MEKPFELIRALVFVIIWLVAFVSFLRGLYHQIKLIKALKVHLPERWQEISPWNNFTNLAFVTYVFNDQDGDNQAILVHKKGLKVNLIRGLVCVVLGWIVMSL